MPRGASPKREREYEKLKDRFEESGRYPGREKEVASRIVNKQRARYGETKKARRQERQGRSPDRDLPVPGYRHLTIAQLEPRLDRLSRSELKQVRQFEEAHKDRQTLLRGIGRRLRAA